MNFCFPFRPHAQAFVIGHDFLKPKGFIFLSLAGHFDNFFFLQFALHNLIPCTWTLALARHTCNLFNLVKWIHARSIAKVNRLFSNNVWPFEAWGNWLPIFVLQILVGHGFLNLFYLVFQLISNLIMLFLSIISN